MLEESSFTAANTPVTLRQPTRLKQQTQLNLTCGTIV